jgi:hypothetical protein
MLLPVFCYGVIRMNTRLLVITIALLAAATTAHAGKIYKWVDENGNVNYGERPPSKHASELTVQGIQKNPPAAAPAEGDAAEGEGEAAPDADASGKPADRKEKRAKLLESLQKEREEKELAKNKADKQQAQRQENCSRARKNMISLKMGGPRYSLTESGERHYLSDEEIAKETAQAEKDITEWCDE